MNTQQVREIRKVNKYSSVNNSKHLEEKKGLIEEGEMLEYCVCVEYLEIIISILEFSLFLYRFYYSRPLDTAGVRDAIPNIVKNPPITLSLKVALHMGKFNQPWTENSIFAQQLGMSSGEPEVGNTKMVLSVHLVKSAKAKPADRKGQLYLWKINPHVSAIQTCVELGDTQLKGM